MSQAIIRCPGCGKGYSVGSDKLGRRVQCKACGQAFVATDSGQTPRQSTAPVTPPVAPQASPTAVETPPVAASPVAAPAPTPSPIFSATDESSSEGQTTFPQPSSNGFAIGSLICGLVMCVPLSGVMAIILGVIGVRKAKQRGGAGHGLAIVGIVLGAVATLMMIPEVIFFTSVVMPTFARAHEVADRVKCAANLHNIGQAIAAYQSSNGRAMPADLGVLVKNGSLPAAFLICPDDKATVAPASTYLYRGASFASAPTPRDVVAYEPVTVHGDGGNALFGDGQVAWLDPKQLAQAAQAPIRSVSSARQSFVAASRPAATSSVSRRIDPTAIVDPSALVGKWTSSNASMERGQSGPATVIFNADGTYLYHTMGQKGAIDFTGKWELSRDSLRMNVSKRSGIALGFLHWRIRRVQDGSMTVRGRYEEENWTKQ